MAANDTAALIVAMEAKLDKFEKALNDSVKIADRAAKSIEGRFDELNRHLKGKWDSFAADANAATGVAGMALRGLGPAGLAASLGIGAVVLAFNAAASAAQGLAEKAKGIRDLAASTGLTTLEVQALGRAAGRVGVSTDEVSGFLARFTVRLDELQKGSGEMREQLLAINPELVEQLYKAKSTAEAITILARAYQSLGSAQRNALSQAAGAGRQGIGAVSRLLGSGVDIAKEVKDLAESGKALDENLIQKLPQLALEIEKMSKKAKENIVSIFAEDALVAQREFAANLLKMSEIAKAFALSEDGKFLLGALRKGFSAGVGLLTGATYKNLYDQFRGNATPAAASPAASAGKMPETTSFKEAAKAADEYGVELDDLFIKREKLVKDRDLVLAAAAKGDPTGQFAREANTLGKEIDKLDAKFDKLAGRPQRITVTPSGGLDDLRALQQQVAAQRDLVTAKGEAATESDRLRLKELEAALAGRANNTVRDAAIQGLNAYKLAMREADLAVRERLGIATEEEIIQTKLARLEADRARGLQLTAAQAAQAEAIIRKEAKETAEAMQVRASQYPQLTRLALDYANTAKQVDQVLVSSMSNFENAFADAITGTKSFSAAFRDMANSILKDIIKLTVRQSITGPLISGLLGMFSGSPTGAVSSVLSTNASVNEAVANYLPKLAGGGSIPPGGMALVSEHSPGGGRVIKNATSRPMMVTPNDVRGGGSGPMTIAPVYQVDARGADPAAISRLEKVLAANTRAIVAQGRAMKSQARYSSTGVY